MIIVEFLGEAPGLHINEESFVVHLLPVRVGEIITYLE